MEYIDFQYEEIPINFSSGFTKKRDCFPEIQDYLYNTAKENKICAIYGLRRTGKTTLLKQAIEELSEEDKTKTFLITCNVETDFHSVISFINSSIKNGKKYFFIDEITYSKGFQQIGEILSDNFVNIHDARIVVTGTDSLALYLSSHSNLYDRVRFIPTTFSTFSEYSYIMDCSDIDEYIKLGSTFVPTIYENKANADEYVKTSIANNLINSIKKSEGKNNFQPELTELYDNDEIRTAIELIINKYNKLFSIRSLRATFESSIFTRSLNKLIKDDPDIIDAINKNQINANISELLEIVPPENIKTNITQKHIAQLEDLLFDMDFLMRIPTIENYNNKEISSPMKIITHPGLYHANIEYTLHEIGNDNNWIGSYNNEQKEKLIKKAYDYAMGDLMENFIIANVNEILNKSKSVSMIDLFNDNITRWFVSKYEMYDSEKKHHESDLIIFDKQKKEIFLFEIKHSAENTPEQTQHLENKEFLNKIKDSFGKIAGRYVLYNGNNDFSTEIPRISAVDFLNTIYQLKKENIIDINLSIQKIKDKSQQFSKSEDINKPTKKRKDSEWEY